MQSASQSRARPRIASAPAGSTDVVELDFGIAAKEGNEIEDAREDHRAKPERGGGWPEAVEKGRGRGAERRDDIAEHNGAQIHRIVQCEISA